MIQIDARAAGLQSAHIELDSQPAVLRPGVATVISRRLEQFECSTLQPALADIARAANPHADLAFAPVTVVHHGSGFCNIRDFHKGQHGLIYIRATFQAARANQGLLLYGADGPVQVWVNGRAVDCRPSATNPALDRQFRVTVQWAQGQNEIVFGLVTNQGNAWGVYATAVDWGRM